MSLITLHHEPVVKKSLKKTDVNEFVNVTIQ